MDVQVTATVEVAEGKLRGRLSEGVESFLGVPFAAPPVGALRFRAPQPAASWAGVRDAFELADEAPQDLGATGSFLGVAGKPESEDCLYLNVWRPVEAGGEALPVMLFVHGGGFSFGSAVHPCYDGASLARNGRVIVVTIAYRLGVLGFLAHPCLEDGDEPYFANYGLQDQMAGLRWVHENIAAFAGDPDNITLFGESAGGVSVGLLAASPVSRPHVRRAIVQSGAPLPVARDQHVAGAEAFIAEAGIAATAEALRGLSVERILAVQATWVQTVGAGRPAARPMLDGVLVPEQPNVTAGSGAMRDLDLMVSYNRDEFTMFSSRVPAAKKPTDDASLAAILEAGGLPASLADTYREARKARGEAADTLSVWLAIMTDRMIRVPSLLFLERHTAAGGRGYACAVTWGSAEPTDHLDGRPYGATHTAELPPLFGTCDATLQLQKVAGDGKTAAPVSAALQQIWTGFARDGMPSAPGLAACPQFKAPDFATTMIEQSATTQNDPWGPERRAMQAAMLENGELS